MPTPHGNYGGTFLVSGCQYCGNVIRKIREFEKDKGWKNSKIQKLNDLQKRTDSKRSKELNRNQTYKSKGSTEKQMNPKRIKDSLQDSEQEDAEIQNIASKV